MDWLKLTKDVSTHSRPKAAGILNRLNYKIFQSFNTQPPEGGWILLKVLRTFQKLFQHTAARRRLGGVLEYLRRVKGFQHTAARRRLARPTPTRLIGMKFQHTAARRRLDDSGIDVLQIVSFNTQPPEGGWYFSARFIFRRVGFNTQPPEGGWPCLFSKSLTSITFQHTAARRRLEEADYINVILY